MQSCSLFTVFVLTAFSRRLSIVKVIDEFEREHKQSVLDWYQTNASQYILRENGKPSLNIEPESFGWDTNILLKLRENTIYFCDLDSAKEIIEDNIFVDLFDKCNDLSIFWDEININLAYNITHSINNTLFNINMMIKYGVSPKLIKKITSLLESGLEKYHPLLKIDIAYHIIRWVIKKKMNGVKSYRDLCESLIAPEIILKEMQQCMTKEYFSIIHNMHYLDYSGVDGGRIPNLNCSKWANNEFAFGLNIEVEIALLVWLNGGAGIALEMSNSALAEVYYNLGIGLSLALPGLALGVEIPFLGIGALPKYEPWSIVLKICLEFILWIGGGGIFDSHTFKALGGVLDVGLGFSDIPLVLTVGGVYRSNIASFDANITAICETFSHKTLPPFSISPSRRTRSPSRRTRSPSKRTRDPSRSPSHHTISPSHRTISPSHRTLPPHGSDSLIN